MSRWVKRAPLIVVIATTVYVGHGVVRSVDALIASYYAYREQATEMAISRRSLPPFSSIDGHMVGVVYKLESVEVVAADEIRMVAVQSVHFQRGWLLDWGTRKIARIRHNVIMKRVEDTWIIDELHQEAMETTSLADAVDFDSFE